VVTRQLQVERRTGKVRRSKTNVLPLCHASVVKNSNKTLSAGQRVYEGTLMFERTQRHMLWLPVLAMNVCMIAYNDMVLYRRPCAGLELQGVITIDLISLHIGLPTRITDGCPVPGHCDWLEGQTTQLQWKRGSISSTTRSCPCTWPLWPLQSSAIIFLAGHMFPRHACFALWGYNVKV